MERFEKLNLGAFAVSDGVAQEMKGRRVSRKLISQYLEPNPHHPDPGNVRVKEGVSIWALVAYLRVPEATIEQVAQDFELPTESVVAALGFYRRNRVPINLRLLNNSI